MLGLDARSIILLAGMLGLMMSLVLLVLRRSYPASIQGLGEWAWGPFLCFVSTVLLGLRGSIPDVVTVVIGNLLLLGSSAMGYFGSQLFFGRPPARRFWGTVILATAPVFAWFLLVQPHYAARLVVFTGTMVCLLFSHAMLLFRARPAHIFTQLTAGVLLLQTGFMVLRLASIPLDSGMQSVTDSSQFQAIYLTSYALCILLVAIGTVLMATERVRAEFEHIATHDTLTGALMRRAFLEACEQELERCRRHGHAMTLMMMDLDHFKSVNDTHGHMVGDRVLADFAGRVRQQLRLPDRLGRFGGEEFVLLLPNTRLEEALHVAQRVRASPPQVPGLPSCTVSIGVTSLRNDSDTLDDLLARSDAAMYRAKANGRDRVETA